MRRTPATALALLALAACGKREPLQPGPGAAMPIRPAMAARTPTADELLRASPEQRPERSEELLKQSEERMDDRFDLPPPG